MNYSNNSKIITKTYRAEHYEVSIRVDALTIYYKYLSKEFGRPCSDEIPEELRRQTLDELSYGHGIIDLDGQREGEGVGLADGGQKVNPRSFDACQLYVVRRIQEE